MSKDFRQINASLTPLAETSFIGTVTDDPEERNGRIYFVLHRGDGHDPMFTNCFSRPGFDKSNPPKKGQKIIVRGGWAMKSFGVVSWELA